MNISGSVTFGATTVPYGGEVDLKGDIDALHFLTNVILTPLGNKTLFGASVTPLVGAGIGFFDYESKITAVGTQTATSEVSNTDFLVSIMAGLEYTSSQQVTWAIKYRHMWADTGKNGVEDAEADNIYGKFKNSFLSKLFRQAYTCLFQRNSLFFMGSGVFYFMLT